MRGFQPKALSWTAAFGAYREAEDPLTDPSAKEPERVTGSKLAPARRLAVSALMLAGWATAGCGDSSMGSAPSGLPTPPPSVVPTLISPADGASLGNDCTGDVWEFNWWDVPQSSNYHLQAFAPGASTAMIDIDSLTSSAYHWARPAYVDETSRRGWRWRVRAKVDGAWREFSAERTFDVDALVPALILPREGEVLDNGCTDRSNGILWQFDWSECRSASNYHLHVIGPGARFPVVDDERLTASEYTFLTDGYVVEANRRGWRWKVRAKIDGVWRDFTPARIFDV